MKYLIKGFVLAAIVVIGTATVSSVDAISSDEAVQSALDVCRVQQLQM